MGEGEEGMRVVCGMGEAMEVRFLGSFFWVGGYLSFCFQFIGHRGDFFGGSF